MSMKEELLEISCAFDDAKGELVRHGSVMNTSMKEELLEIPCVFDGAKGELVRHGSVMNTHVLLKRDNTSVCLVEEILRFQKLKF